MSDFLNYWDTRIIRNKRVFDAHPQIANFVYCECAKIWDYMEGENKALLTRHNALVEAVAWERECSEVIWPAYRSSAYMELVSTKDAARAEVDRLTSRGQVENFVSHYGAQCE